MRWYFFGGVFVVVFFFVVVFLWWCLCGGVVVRLGFSWWCGNVNPPVYYKIRNVIFFKFIPASSREGFLQEKHCH